MDKNPRPLSVVLGCDCDPDRSTFGGYPYAEDKLAWRGNEIGIKRFQRAREEFHRRTDMWPLMSWFIRADAQVAYIYGDAGYCLQKDSALWTSLESDGDEIAWHPHFWARSDTHGWYQNISDDAFMRSCLKAGFAGFTSARGRPPTTSHMGWCFHNNTSIGILAEMGLTADCSAVPGHNSLGAGRLDQSDWSLTPLHPYHPSSVDYRQPARADGTALPILEIPVSVGNAKILRVLKTLRFAMKHGVKHCSIASFEEQVPNIAFPPSLFRPIADRAIARIAEGENDYFMTYCHSDELLPKSNKRGMARWLYRLENIFTNLEYVVRTLEKQEGIQPKFSTLSELAQRLSTKKIGQPSKIEDSSLGE